MHRFYKTNKGDIHYWIEKREGSNLTLVFLPGLTATHRLFERQLEFFDNYVHQEAINISESFSAAKSEWDVNSGSAANSEPVAKSGFDSSGGSGANPSNASNNKSGANPGNAANNKSGANPSNAFKSESGANSNFASNISYSSSICYSTLAWDAPGHGRSRPFDNSYSLADKAKWLKEILDFEGITSFVLIGQSMGGFLGQAFIQQYPGLARGFIAIDACSLRKKYLPGWALWSLKHTRTAYKLYPWKLLLKHGSRGCAETEYGISLMEDIMREYNDPSYYKELCAYGFRILAEAVEVDLPYKLDCPALLICGTKDKAGIVKKLILDWHKDEGLPLEMIAGAGHNSNTDDPERVNSLIEGFLMEINGKDD